MSDHTVSQSLYLRDPDGNEVELYVDADEATWKNNPAAVVSPIKPLVSGSSSGSTLSSSAAADG